MYKYSILHVLRQHTCTSIGGKEGKLRKNIKQEKQFLYMHKFLYFEYIHFVFKIFNFNNLSFNAKKIRFFSPYRETVK